MNHRQFFGAAILQKVHSGLIADISVWVQSSGQGYEVKINIVDHEMDSKALVNLILIWIFQIRLQSAFHIWWSLKCLLVNESFQHTNKTKNGNQRQFEGQ